MAAPLLLSRNEINDVRWNELIKQSEQQIIYGYTWYLDVVSDDWKALVWPSAEDYAIVMPLPVITKWLIEVIQQPLFCQYLGLFSRQTLNADELNAFLTTLSEHFVYISSYHFNPSNTELLTFSLAGFTRFQYTVNNTYWLSLDAPHSHVVEGFRADRKNNLKRSAGKNRMIFKSDDLEPMIQLFRENHEATVSGGVNTGAYETLAKLYGEVIKKQSAELSYVLNDGIIHAGILIVRSGNKAIYLFNAADRIGRGRNARTFLLNEYFKENDNSSVIFDFESPEIASIARFYQSFGAKVMPYFVVKSNNLPFPLRQLQNWRLKNLTNTRQVLF